MNDELEDRLADLLQPAGMRPSVAADGRTDSLKSLIEERLDLRNHAAAEAGAEDQVTLFRIAQAVDPQDLLARFESGAIIPLDDAIARAAREAAPLAEHEKTVLSRTFPAAVRKTGAALGQDPDTTGPLLLQRRAGCLSPCRALDHRTSSACRDAGLAG